MIYLFERTELRTLQNVCANNEEFLTQLSVLVGKLYGEVKSLRDSLDGKVNCIRVMTEEAHSLIQERDALQRKVEQLQKKYNDFA